MTTVRALQAHEWPLYRDLRLAALRDAPDAFGSTLAREEAFPEQEWITRLAAGAASPRDYPMVAEEDSGRAIGLGWVRLEPSDSSTAMLYQVWIHPDARRRRVGMMLLDSAVQWAREAGARTLMLHVALGPESAIAFYHRAGFVERGECSPLRLGSDQLQQPMQLAL